MIGFIKVKIMWRWGFFELIKFLFLFGSWVCVCECVDEIKYGMVFFGFY